MLEPHPTGEIRFCRRCLYGSSHPLGITFDDRGICSGCRIHEEKDRLDWNERWRLLEELVWPYRSASGRTYDCIVPVTGGQDSHYLVHLVKHRLGLNPLLVTYNRYFNTPLGIRNLANLRIRFDCDILAQNVNPQAVKRITRATLRRFGSIYWHCLAGQSVFPVQTAVRFRVPLIIWGAHQGVEQVGMFSHEHAVEMTRRYRKDHDLMGYEADDLLSTFDTLRDDDVWQYRYPEDRDLHAVGVRGIYLGNYVRWDPKTQHEQMIRDFGYETASFARTFEAYDHGDCFNYMDFHDLLKLYKHGYSKVTDHACREIRHGRLTRSQAESLVRCHELEAPRHADLFCQWLGITRESLRFLTDQFRSRSFWRERELGEWEFHGWSTRRVGTEAPAAIEYVRTGEMERGEARRYVVVGKGVP